MQKPLSLTLTGSNARQKVMTADGHEIELHARDLLRSGVAGSAISKSVSASLQGVAIGTVASLASYFFIFAWLRRRGEQQSETRKIRGDEIADSRTVRKLILRSKKASDISIAGLPMPENFEVRHVLVHGTIGSGKSVLIREMLDQIRKRGDRAIIYDKGCDFIRTHYQDGKDVILNPLDERTAAWHLWEECRDFADFDSLAAALMPMHGTDNPYWITSARTVFSATAARMQYDKDKSMSRLLKMLLSADLSEIEKFLQGTEAEILVSPKMERTAVTIKSVIATCAKALKYLRDAGNENDSFSIRKWIQDEGQNSWLFVSSLADKHETLKPLITMWLDIAINSLMSLPPSQDRSIWIILDELPTLNRLPCLMSALAEARKFGGCMVAGIQGIAQLREIYGTNGAEGISGLCNTKWYFRSPSFDTANWVSRELGQAELEEVREGISYGESAVRSGISISRQQTNRQIVSPSDIMRLPDLSAYARLPGGYPVTKVELQFQERKEHARHFVARNFDNNELNEIDKLARNAEMPSENTGIPGQGKIMQQEASLEW